MGHAINSGTVGHTGLSVVVDALGAVPNFLHSVIQANAAARSFEQLSHLSDGQLAARGLSRDGLAQYICETYFSG